MFNLTMSPERPPLPDRIIVASWDDLEEVLPPETLTRFTVPDALNPYREALLEGGIPDTDPATAEHKDQEVNLGQILTKDIASYRASGLEHWAVALEAIRSDIRLTPDKRVIIEQEIKDGAMPIFMPGRAAQLETTPDQYQTGFQPVWIKNGTVQTPESAYLWEHTKKLISDKNPALVEDIPERPYIQLAKPTKQCDPRTTNKTVDQQQAELLKIQNERKQAGQAMVYSTNPAEWGALEKLFTAAIRDQAPISLVTLTPLDDIDNSYTRFIRLPLSSDANVPVVYFNPVTRRLRFVGGGAGFGDSMSGFRLSVRVEV